MKQKRKENSAEKRNRGVFFCPAVNDRQKNGKKDKEEDGNLLKNMVCKRLTYNSHNGILQEKKRNTELPLPE